MSRNYVRRASPIMSYRLTSPVASQILDHNKTISMDYLVNEGLADLVAVGYEVYVNAYDIMSAMKRYGHNKYVYPSWIKSDAQRFIVQDSVSDEKTFHVYLSIKEIFKLFDVRNQGRYYIFITDVEYDATTNPRKPRKAKETEDKITVSERTKILGKLNKLRGEIDILIEEVCAANYTEGTIEVPETIVTITESDKGHHITTTRKRAFNQSLYLRQNGRANLMFLSEALAAYIKDQPNPVPLTELHEFGIKYFPKIGDRKTIIKAVTNAIDIYMKHDDSIAKPGRGLYSAK